MQGNEPSGKLVKLARSLFFALGVFWIVLGVVSVARILLGPVASSMTAWLVAGLMFPNAAILFWLGWGIGRRSRSFWYLGVLYLAAVIVLTITDQFGILDLAVLIVQALLLSLLLGTRKIYLAPASSSGAVP